MAALFAAVACYDDSALRKDIEALTLRVTELENDVKTNVSAIEELVAAVANKFTIVSVTDGKDGYTILFSNGTEAVITNGINGTNGEAAPVLGVMKEGDVYYWTLGGEPLLIDGAKVPVSGADGKSPQFKIEDNVWMVSYDGSAWAPVPVTGSQDRFSMEETDSEYVFNFGAASIRIPKADVFAIKVTSDALDIKAGMTVTFNYELIGADETTHVVVESKNIEAVLNETDKTVTVKAPDVISDAYVLVKAVRNSDSKYSAQYISIRKMDAYGTFGGYIVSHENEYLNW